jgi:hypothetical protein
LKFQQSYCLGASVYLSGVLISDPQAECDVTSCNYYRYPTEISIKICGNKKIGKLVDSVSFVCADTCPDTDPIC